MSEELINNEPIEEGVDVQKYLDTINDLKKNTVSKDDYRKLKEENATLLSSIMEGRTMSAAEEVKKPTAQELRNKLYGKGCEDLTDLEYMTLTCDLRDVLLEEQGIDYMAPTGSQYQADVNDIAAANKSYNGFRHCIEVADGDNDIFLQELSRITGESALDKMRNIRRK